MAKLISGSTIRRGGSGEFIDLAGAMPQLPPTDTTATGFTIVTDSLLRTTYRSSLGFVEFSDASMYSSLPEGTIRILDFQTSYQKPAPFQFILKNKNLSVNQGEGMLLELQLQGDLLPQDVYIHYGENTYKLDKKDISNFEYNLLNIQNSDELYFSGGEFNSETYKLNVLKSSINITKELQNYKWVTDKNGNTLNQPADSFNHGMDAIRYVALNKLGIKPKGSFYVKGL
jgi:hypothetical protein